MKTPYVIMQKSAIGNQQRCSILSNELVRRLSNVNVGKVHETEVVEIIEKFISQMKNSGYEIFQAREITCSGLKGWIKKRERREREGKGFYRTGKATLPGRVRKKLLEKETWFRQEKVEEEWERDEEEEREIGKRRGKKEGEQELGGKKVKDLRKVKAVMFVPHTVESGLAKQLREMEYKMEEMTGNRLKIVENSGEKLEDLLTSSNIWKGQECGRDQCLLCETKTYTGKKKRQECHRRNLVLSRGPQRSQRGHGRGNRGDW